MISRCPPTGDGTEPHCSGDLSSVWKRLTGQAFASLSERHQLTLAKCCRPDTSCCCLHKSWPWMIDYSLSALANQSLNWAWFSYRSLSLSMKGLASALASPSQWMAAFWARPCYGRAFVSLTDGFGLLNSFQRSLLTWSHSAGGCQGLVASAASRDSCREWGASSTLTPT